MDPDQRLQDRGASLGEPHRQRVHPPPGLDVPPARGQHRGASGGPGPHVRERGAGPDPPAGPERQRQRDVTDAGAGRDVAPPRLCRPRRGRPAARRRRRAPADVRDGGAGRLRRRPHAGARRVGDLGPRARPGAPRSVMPAERWEHGSHLHWVLDGGCLDAPWSGIAHTLWGTGRYALRALLAWGRDELRWQRVLVPTFFCQEVVQALARELPISLYPDAPADPLPTGIEAGERDVVLLVNTYGMRTQTRIQTRAVVVEDHTHDPLSRWAFD